MQGAGLPQRLVQPGSHTRCGDPRPEGNRTVLRRGDWSHPALANPFRWCARPRYPGSCVIWIWNETPGGGVNPNSSVVL
jgi:hypothetical protein